MRDELTRALRDLTVGMRRLEAQLQSTIDRREQLASHHKVALYLTLHQQEQALRAALETARDEVLRTVANLTEVLE